MQWISYRMLDSRFFPVLVIYTYSFIRITCWVKPCVFTCYNPAINPKSTPGNPIISQLCTLEFINELRLALSTVLNGKMGSFVCVIGLICSSFVAISSGTHRRAPWDPFGQTQFSMVQIGNCLAARNLCCIFGMGLRDGGPKVVSKTSSYNGVFQHNKLFLVPI